MNGCVIRLRLDDAAALSAASNKLFVGQLAWECSWEDLRDHFRAIGPLTKAEVVMDQTGRSRGFGFVEFENTEDAGML